MPSPGLVTQANISFAARDQCVETGKSYAVMGLYAKVPITHF
jgi:hypothetical protein